MITAFTVRNFKAIGDEPVRIELKPITLLFGANSAGKSSILHALHYAYEIFINKNLNANKTSLGGNSLDLGGFSRFIYDNDLDKSIVLRFELDFSWSAIQVYAADLISDIEDIKNEIPSFENKYDLAEQYNDIFHVPNLLYKATSAYVEVEITWSHIQKSPYVRRYETGINNVRIATIVAKKDEKKIAVSYFNMGHPVFSDLWIKHGINLDCLVMSCVENYYYIIKSMDSEENDVDYDYEFNTEESRQQVYKRLGRIPAWTNIPFSGNENLNLILRNQDDALPRFFRPLSFGDIWRNPPQSMDTPGDIEINDYLTPVLPYALRNLLNCILIEPGRRVAEWLESLCYLGPLRETPPRHFTSNPKVELGRWATGLAAWDVLYQLGQKRVIEPPEPVVDKVNQQLIIINDWLASKHRLNTGYRILIEYYREIPSTHPLLVPLNKGQSLSNNHELIDTLINLPEKMRFWLQDARGFKFTPHEIGIGISQVLPVVVAAVSSNSPLVAIEQPELHIHPAVQVELGDLFINQSKNNTKAYFLYDRPHPPPRIFLIETHSEHLLLRILRRIRETAEGQAPEKAKLLPNEVAVYYVESENGITQANRIGLDENGRFTDRWPKGFFPERMQEMLSSDIRDRVESKRCEKK